MDYAIPASKIAALSSGEFVGIIADNSDEKINLKMFHSEIQNNHNAIAEEEAKCKSIPEINKVSYSDIIENYIAIKGDIDQRVKDRLKNIEENTQVNKANDTDGQKNEDAPMEQHGIYM